MRSWDWVRTQKELREVFGENIYEPLHRLIESYARLQLLKLDERVRQQIEESTDYVGLRLPKDRSQTTLDEWPSVRRRLLEAIAASGDEAAIAVAARSDAGDLGSDSGQNSLTQSAE